MKKVFEVLMSCLIIFFLTGCTTTVTFRTDVEGAEIFLDGEPLGTTPVTKKISNLAWVDPDVVIKKQGYKTEHKWLDREVKTVSLIGGVLTLPFCVGVIPLLCCYGPKKNQFFFLRKELDYPSE